MTVTEAADFIRGIFNAAPTTATFTVEESTAPAELNALKKHKPLALKITGTCKGVSCNALMLIHPKRRIDDADDKAALAMAMMQISGHILKTLESKTRRAARNSSKHN